MIDIIWKFVAIEDNSSDWVQRSEAEAKIREAVAKEHKTLEDDFLKLADGCARSNAPLQENTWRRAANIVRARAQTEKPE